MSRKSLLISAIAFCFCGKTSPAPAEPRKLLAVYIGGELRGCMTPFRKLSFVECALKRCTRGCIREFIPLQEFTKKLTPAEISLVETAPKMLYPRKIHENSKRFRGTLYMRGTL